MLTFLMTFVGDDPEDQERFRRLYFKYNKLMYTRALNYTGNEQDADDIVQEAFIKVAKHFDNIKDPDSDATRHFLLTIVGNCAKDELERIGKRRKAEEAAVKKWEQEAEASRNSDSYSQPDLKELIKKIPEIYRRPLYMYYEQGISTSEIAELLEISEAGVRKRLERARKLLREMIGEDYGRI